MNRKIKNLFINYADITNIKVYKVYIYMYKVYIKNI